MVQKVGVILVHGIGEQKRFEHLDEQLRGLLEVLKHQHDDVTVEIPSAPAAANLAAQDTWRGGSASSLRIIIPSKQVEIHVHEVWWADINEPYSLIKQLRFWFWALSVWCFPSKLKSNRKLATSRMETIQPHANEVLSARLKIYWISTFFTGLSFTLGLFFWALKRLLDINPPTLMQTFTNYLSSIKLYNQQVRLGLGVPGVPADFLDALGEPPRVSIRRRMVRAIADVAGAGYDRWYILAHSLGSIVAFNGIQEPAYAFPAYLDEERWQKLKADGMGGAANPAHFIPPPAGEAVSPQRPGWLKNDVVAFRAKIFKNFHGVLTYGCPLGKFSAIWPALIPFCAEPAFQKGTVWINAFDPLDPVSGPLKALDFKYPASVKPRLECCPPRSNLGYASSDVLLLAHVKYLTPHPDQIALVDLVADWIVTDNPAPMIDRPTGGRFFKDDSARMGRRAFGLVAQWLLANLVVVAFEIGGVLALWIWHDCDHRLPDLDLTQAALAIAMIVLAPVALNLLVGFAAFGLPGVFRPDKDRDDDAQPHRSKGPQQTIITPLPIVD